VRGLGVDVSHDDGAVIARLSGDVDMLNSDELGATLLERALTSRIGLVLDMSSVRYVDSAGVRALFALVNELRRVRLGLVCVLTGDSPLWRLLKVTNFDESVPILPSCSDAVRRLRDAS
jgi:anti-anti-sigma factor